MEFALCRRKEYPFFILIGPLYTSLVTDMLMAVLNICSKEELEDEKNAAEMDEAEARRNVIRNKIKAVGKMARVFQVLREESESIAELKSLMGTNQLPQGSLALGAEGIKRAITSFDQAKLSDAANERLPPVRSEEKATAPRSGKSLKV